MKNDFGRMVHVLGLSLRGTVSLGLWRQFLLDLCRTMGMTPVHSQATYRYPVGGKGGTGFTIVQPITDSFIALDVWPDHEGAYLHLCSCKPFNGRKITDFVNNEFTVLDTMSGDLRL